MPFISSDRITRIFQLTWTLIISFARKVAAVRATADCTVDCDEPSSTGRLDRRLERCSY